MSISNHKENNPQSLSLAKCITEILYKHDPLRIAFGENTLEYNNEAASIAARLCAGMTHEEIGTIVDDALSDWFWPDWHTCRPSLSKAHQLEVISGAIASILESYLAS